MTFQLFQSTDHLSLRVTCACHLSQLRRLQASNLHIPYPPSTIVSFMVIKFLQLVALTCKCSWNIYVLWIGFTYTCVRTLLISLKTSRSTGNLYMLTVKVHFTNSHNRVQGTSIVSAESRNLTTDIGVSMCWILNQTSLRRRRSTSKNKTDLIWSWG